MNLEKEQERERERESIHNNFESHDVINEQCSEKTHTHTQIYSFFLVVFF